MAGSVNALAAPHQPGRGDMMRLLASQAASSSPEAAARPTGRTELPALTALALRVGAMAAATMRVHDVLVEVCRALPHAAHAAGAVVVLTGSVDVWRPIRRRRGWASCSAGPAPVRWATRCAPGGRCVTPDLTRVGPPDLAAAAAERGLVTSVVMPLVARDRGLGGLQLLGDARTPVGIEHIELLRPLVAALSARLVDVLTIEELNRAARRAAAGQSPVPPAARRPSARGRRGRTRTARETVEVIGWFGPVEPQPAASVDGAGR